MPDHSGGQPVEDLGFQHKWICEMAPIVYEPENASGKVTWNVGLFEFHTYRVLRLLN